MPVILASLVSCTTSFNSHNSPVRYMPLGCFQPLQLYEWVMLTSHCPQQPCSASVDSWLWLLLWSQCSPYLALLPSAFPSKNPAFSVCAWSRTALVMSFLPLTILQAQFALGPTCSLSWWSRVSVELSSKMMFQMNQHFLSVLFTTQLLHLYIVLI